MKGGQVCNWALVPRRILRAIFVPVSRRTDASHAHKQVKKKVVSTSVDIRNKPIIMLTVPVVYKFVKFLHLGVLVLQPLLWNK